MLRVTLFLLVTSACAPFAAAAAWDFNDWTFQGWTLGGNPAAGVAPNPVLGLPEPSDNTGSLYLADGAYAWITVPDTNSFVFSASVAWASAANKLTGSGLAYRAAHNRDTTGPNALPAHAVTGWFEGKSVSSDRMVFRDAYGGASDDAMPWLPTAAASARLTIDYNYTMPGRVVLTWLPLDYVPAGGIQLNTHIYVSPLDVNDTTGTYHTINEIRLGGSYSQTQAYFDDVTFVPEPATVFVLAIGAVPILRRRR